MALSDFLYLFKVMIACAVIAITSISAIFIFILLHQWILFWTLIFGQPFVYDIIVYMRFGRTKKVAPRKRKTVEELIEEMKRW